ncbi:MAG: hypothetical protein JOY84_22965 [Curvibacter sp.]|nr:hypothetical protein [Curvibacter sp.]
MPDKAASGEDPGAVDGVRRGPHPGFADVRQVFKERVLKLESHGPWRPAWTMSSEGAGGLVAQAGFDWLHGQMLARPLLVWTLYLVLLIGAAALVGVWPWLRRAPARVLLYGLLPGLVLGVHLQGLSPWGLRTLQLAADRLDPFVGGVLPALLGGLAGWGLGLLGAVCLRPGRWLLLCTLHLWALAVLASVVAMAQGQRLQGEQLHLMGLESRLRQASTELADQVRRYEAGCHTGPQSDGRRAACRWARAVQQPLNDFRLYRAGQAARTGPASSADLYGPTPALRTPLQQWAVQAELARFNAQQCAPEPVLRAAPRRAAVALPCLVHDAQLDWLAPAERAPMLRRPVALANEVLVPSVVHWYQQAQAQQSTVRRLADGQRWRGLADLLVCLLGGACLGLVLGAALCTRRRPRPAVASSAPMTPALSDNGTLSPGP